MDKFDVDVSIVSRLPLSGADAEWLLNKFIIDFFFSLTSGEKWCQRRLAESMPSEARRLY